MDNVTHAALGIAVGIAVHRRGSSVSAAAVAALLAAEAPDLDVFLRAADDPLVAFRWHRHFTHSFFFMPVWALLSAWLTAFCFRRSHNVGWRELFLPALAGALTHLLCDGCTSYGTMLLWPFTETRYAWDCLPIIDLLATLPLLVLAILAWRKHSPRLATYGLLWFVAYASLGRWQHARAESSLRTWLAQKNIDPGRLAVKPTISNLVVWRAVWLHDGRWQVAAIRNVPFTSTRLVIGESRAAWSADSAGNPPALSEGAHIIADFSRFTGGWNSYDVLPGAISVGDIRFSMLPTSSKPLWSVRCAPGGKLTDTALIMDRGLQEGDWSRLGALLSGSDPRFIEIK
jgi:inner membrane protein